MFQLHPMHSLRIINEWAKKDKLSVTSHLYIITGNKVWFVQKVLVRTLEPPMMNCKISFFLVLYQLINI